jgi:hypothetical protein
MAGIPTKFVIADRVFDAVRAVAGPFADFLDDPQSRPYAYLGAIGSALGDFLPARPEPMAPPTTPYFQAWLPVLRLLAGSPAAGGTPATNGIYQDLKTLRDTLAKLDQVVKDKSKFGLLGIKDELEALPGVVNAIQTQMRTVGTLRATIASAITSGGPRDKVAPASGWFPRDTLQWSHTGRFLQALRKRADDSGDKRLKAFALGAVVGYGADLCGNPFINSVVGAPYRNHWWRRRWISNFVDTWVWGFYGKGGAATVSVPANGVPNPLYTNWPNVCEAKLHERITLPGISPDPVLLSIRTAAPLPAVLPQAFLDFWLGAYGDAYGPPPPTSGIDAAGLQSAYALTWLTLWFQTSSEVIPCIPADRVNPPDDCGERPDWVAADGSVVIGGTLQSPPQPEKATKPSTAEEVSGIILAILGALEILEGLLVGGLLVIIGAILIVDAETDPDWEKLRCHVGWVKVFLFYVTDAMHGLLKWASFAFPYTLELAHNETLRQQDGTRIEPFDSALVTVQSPGPNERYPAGKWIPTAPNWQNFPTEGPEQPGEFSYPGSLPWPFSFVDGRRFTSPTTAPTQVNPRFTVAGASVPLVRDRNEWSARRGRLNVFNATATPIGNAVDICLDLIFAKPGDYLDWDLDGDPGIGYPTWLLPSTIASRNMSIAEP